MTGFPLSSLDACLTDLTAAHKHAADAAGGLSGARQTRAAELQELIADAIAFCRRLGIVVEGDARADEASSS